MPQRCDSQLHWFADVLAVAFGTNIVVQQCGAFNFHTLPGCNYIEDGEQLLDFWATALPDLECLYVADLCLCPSYWLSDALAVGPWASLAGLCSRLEDLGS